MGDRTTTFYQHDCGGKPKCSICIKPKNCKCKFCKKIFRRKPSELKRGRGKYCSKNCYTEWRKVYMKKELHPRWMGGINIAPSYSIITKAFYGEADRARRRKAKGEHSLNEWIQLKNSWNNRCASCFQQEPKITITQDHIIPISKGGDHNISNIQPLCRSCNSKKGIKIIFYGRPNYNFFSMS